MLVLRLAIVFSAALMVWGQDACATCNWGPEFCHNNFITGDVSCAPDPCFAEEPKCSFPNMCQHVFDLNGDGSAPKEYKCELDPCAHCKSEEICFDGCRPNPCSKMQCPNGELCMLHYNATAAFGLCEVDPCAKCNIEEECVHNPEFDTFKCQPGPCSNNGPCITEKCEVQTDPTDGLPKAVCIGTVDQADGGTVDCFAKAEAACSMDKPCTTSSCECSTQIYDCMIALPECTADNPEVAKFATKMEGECLVINAPTDSTALTNGCLPNGAKCDWQTCCSVGQCIAGVCTGFHFEPPTAPPTAPPVTGAPTGSTPAGFRAIGIDCALQNDDSCCSDQCKCGFQDSCSGPLTCYGSGLRTAFSHCCKACGGDGDLDAAAGEDSGDLTTVILVVVSILVLVLLIIGVVVWKTKNKQRNPATAKYNVFLSYRVATSAEMVEKVYFDLIRINANKNQFNQKKIFIDKYCLNDGHNWEQDFIAAITQSMFFVPFISIDSTRTKGSLARMIEAAKTPDSNDTKDNVLLEWHLARVLHMVGANEAIYPVLDNGVSTDGQFGTFDFSAINELSSVPSKGTISKLLQYVVEYNIDFDTEEIRTWSAKSTVQYILDNQGVFSDTFGKAAVLIIAEKINTMTESVTSNHSRRHSTLSKHKSAKLGQRNSASVVPKSSKSIVVHHHHHHDDDHPVGPSAGASAENSSIEEIPMVDKV